MEYDKSVIEEHPLFKKYKDKISKYGIESFLQDIGIFGKIVPVLKPPNEQGILELIGFHIDFEYRLNEMKDENHYKMKIIDDFDTYPTKDATGNVIILKAFEIISNNSYFTKRIDELNY